MGGKRMNGRKTNEDLIYIKPVHTAAGSNCF